MFSRGLTMCSQNFSPEVSLITKLALQQIKSLTRASSAVAP